MKLYEYIIMYFITITLDVKSADNSIIYLNMYVYLIIYILYTDRVTQYNHFIYYC